VNAALRLGYEGAARLARLGAALAAGVAPASEAKLLRALRARHGILDRYRAWGKDRRDPKRALLWMHAPSVGEGLQARPVLELMRARHAELQLAYTHFSPSAESFARSLNVDFHDYLPFDTAADAGGALDALRPRALVFSKLDVWPTIARVAHARGVRLGLVSATLSAESGRRATLASALLRDAYRLLDAVGAIDQADAERLTALGVAPSRVSVTGDTRYDQVWQRSQRVDRAAAPLVSLLSSRPTVVAGSTWPSDEAELLPAFEQILHDAAPEARLVIAPHEPVAAHLAPIERWAARAGRRLARLASATANDDVVLVDRIGVLGDLYALADVAYVGGGFHTAGLHSVLEPAAFGAPVLFGPRFTMSRDAVLLVRNQGGASAPNSAALARQMGEWLTRPEERRVAGARANALVLSGLGAAERSYLLVDRLLA
jgi:3-deoxy-D-manno-octulosonic-acid transferase